MSESVKKKRRVLAELIINDSQLIMATFRELMEEPRRAVKAAKILVEMCWAWCTGK